MNYELAKRAAADAESALAQVDPRTVDAIERAAHELALALDRIPTAVFEALTVAHAQAGALANFRPFAGGVAQ